MTALLGALAAAWVGLGAVAVRKLSQDPRLVRNYFRVKTTLPVALDFSLLALAWLASFLLVAVLAGGRPAKRVIRMHYRSQRDELVANVKSTWSTKWVLLYQYLLVGGVIGFGVVAWRGLCVGTNSESPLVVVLSGSMETAFYRGDLLFLTNLESEPVVPGEIVVFKIPGRDIPIVHRVHQVHSNGNLTEDKFLTKGDNNNIHDRGLYAHRQVWLERGQIIGRARFFVPYIGMVTIYLNDYPKLKFGLIGGMVLQVLWTRQV
jgi:signal peptidase